jgi:putative acyl-CoA dehydrogenase
MHTHEVFNQTPVLENVNLYDIDKPLQNFLTQFSTEWGLQSIKSFGAHMGSAEWIKKGFQANQYTPVFRSHDTKGNRIDEVDFHPAYHDIMALGIQHGLHSLPWTNSQQGSHLVRLAMYYFHVQNEAGSGCPITMTFSAIPPLKNHFPLADQWLPKIFSNEYDPANKPFYDKKGLTIGMAMTEKQGGTDVRANTTFATPLSKGVHGDSKRGAGEAYKLTGHKWFCSAPMCDAFLTLAQTEKGLSCFLFPRWWSDGQRNHFRIQRLKDKLGNKSNASSEIELDGALAWLIGEEGRGVPTIIEMVALTRYDCMIGSSALMRRGLSEVLHHISHRKVMGKNLSDQALMQNVAADLYLESEAALAMTVRTALCIENSHNPDEQLLLRLLTPIGKYWITKRASPFLVEAMECLGGNGYVEDSILPRLYREAPVNAIWEGSGNVQCLDVLRAVQKSSDAVEVFMQELESVQGNNSRYDAFLNKIKQELPQQIQQESSARRLTEQLAKAFQAAQLLKYSTETVANAFCESRLSPHVGQLFGNLTDREMAKRILS